VIRVRECEGLTRRKTMRFLVWLCRVIVVVVIGAFVAVIFYLTHSVSMPESAKAALNWATVIGTAVVGLAWPLMRKYWQAFLLLISLGVMRALFGVDPGLSSLRTPLLTPFQSDFLWVSIGVVVVATAAALVTRAILGDRAMRAMRAATTTTVTTGDAVAEQTAAALGEASAPPAPEMVVSGAATVAPPADAPEAGEASEGEAAEKPAKSADADEAGTKK